MSVAAARVALSRGPLIEHRPGTQGLTGRGSHGLPFYMHVQPSSWRSRFLPRARLFNAATIKKLIDAGEAVRVGDEVRAA